ncbi:MAG: prepilin-type N-terminal cleavage/methylation domain-containing protein [Burkholderiales bacterium]|nr:prepilin-type N-terminal cleavage/methylation domain-containing protein [Burkholderiales bacterium]
MLWRQLGFTLLEVMIAMVIIAILAGIAVPAYTDYVTRSRLTEAFSALSVANSSAEKYWSNQSPRTFANFNAASDFPPNTTNFTYALTGATASAYTITATGIGPVAGFVFTINQDGVRTTTGVKAGWSGAGSNCWVIKSSGDCVK